jgi:hypothetical protein
LTGQVLVIGIHQVRIVALFHSKWNSELQVSPT